MSDVSGNGAAFRSQRVLSFPPASVFDAFARPELLARSFDFRPGGRWTFVMHGPEGTRHPNESVFLELRAPSRIVIHHVSLPRYVLTVSLTAQEGATALSWVQEFEDAAVAARLRHIVEPANEQNLERLAVVLAEDGRGR